MGAEVVSRTHGLPLAQALVSPTRKNQENTNILISAAASVETKEEKSTSNTDSICYEFRKDCDNDVIDHAEDNDTISEHAKVKQQQQETSMLPPIFCSLNDRFIEKSTATFVLLPVMSVAVCIIFGTSSTDTLGQFSFTSITSSLLAFSSPFFHRYMATMEEFPMLTKSFTTGIIQFLGDCGAQRYEQHREKDATTIHSNKAYDLRRGLTIFADGLLLSGPLMHYCFEWMEEVWPTSEGEVGEGWTRSVATLCHVFFNDYIIDSTYIALSFVFTGVFEGYSWREIVTIVRKDFGATVRASWLTSLGLIPVEFLCFGYLSLSFRVLAMNFIDLLWGAVVSYYSHRSRREDSKERSEEVSAMRKK